jgi:peroxiredoxin
MQTDQRQVQRENMAFKKGAGATVKLHSYDNNEAHVVFHQKWMKTQDFELLDDQTKQIVEQHVQQHKLEIGRMQQAAAPQGPPEQEGPPQNVSGPGAEPAGPPGV